MRSTSHLYSNRSYDPNDPAAVRECPNGHIYHLARGCQHCRDFCAECRAAPECCRAGGGRECRSRCSCHAAAVSKAVREVYNKEDN